MIRVLEKIYQSAALFKRELYSWGLLDQVTLNVPVISVGNLTFAGAGKTPMVAWLSELAVQKGLQPAIISRNYKSQTKGFSQVDVNNPQGAFIFGDEPFFLASRNPLVPVFVGEEKWQTAQKALEINPEINLIIVDDGFQHLPLKRNLDLVLIDAVRFMIETKDVQNVMREDFKALKAASAVCFTKRNMVSDPEAYELKKQKLGLTCPIYEVDYQANVPIDLFNAEPVKVYAFAGVGDPASVRKLIMSHPHVELVEFIRFENHQNYTAETLQRIVLEAKKMEADLILTTMKDFVKVKSIAHANPSSQVFLDQIKPMDLQISFRTEPQVLDEFLDFYA